MFGADGTFTIASASNPYPVTIISGTVTAVTSITNAVAVTNAGLTELAAAINASSQMDVNVAAGTVAVTNAGLTELAAAINASSQMDVNIAANGIALLTTAAHDAAFGTAGTADAQVRSVQGIASMTPLLVTSTGSIAHDSADSGNPVKIGHKAADIGTQTTAVTAGDRTDWYATRNGIPFMLGGSVATLTKELNVTDADGAQTDTALITVSAGTAIVVTAFQFMADGANTVDVGYRCGFGTANTPAADAAGIISSHPGVKAGSGVVVGNGGGVIGMGASNEDLRLTCEDPVTGAVNIIITYHLVLIG